jgi:hypothetical protein
VRGEVRDQAFGQCRPGQTFRDNIRIVTKGGKKLAQNLGLRRVLRHALHFCLQLLGANWLVPVVRQRFGVPKIVQDLLFKLRSRHHFVERRLGVGALSWPDSVAPVNFFDRSLIGDTIRQRKLPGK